MASAAALAGALRPSAITESVRPHFAAAIPREFSDWSEDPAIIPILPSPDQQRLISEIYDEVVNRTYVNSRGDRIMLSIAYGSRQTQQLKTHRQEVCYAAQGFQIRNLAHGIAQIGARTIPVTRMFAVRDQRHEPVTYWFTIGDRIVLSRTERLLMQLRFGITGQIPDGTLVRISNLSDDQQGSFAAHDSFISSLLNSMTAESGRRLVGTSFGS
jgi:EpsI family protein